MWRIDDARMTVTDYAKQENQVRLHGEIGYVTPLTKLAGQPKAVFANQDTEREAARETQRLRRAIARQNAV
jgi:hypothetical protein